MLFSEMTKEHFNNVLTHWYEKDEGVDIDVGAAVAEVLQINVTIQMSDSENITFNPRRGLSSQKITIRQTRSGEFKQGDSFTHSGEAESRLIASLTEPAVFDESEMCNNER